MARTGPQAFVVKCAKDLVVCIVYAAEHENYPICLVYLRTYY